MIRQLRPNWPWLPLLALIPSFLSLGAQSEIYRWTDDDGRVHFSDRRNALPGSERIDEKPVEVTQDGWAFRFQPVADAMLSSVGKNPQGEATMLSAGYWQSGSTGYQVTSLLRFDITELIAHLNSDPEKRVGKATLRLTANAEDKVYGQGSANSEPPGHSTRQGDNAFFLKPVHNSWQEASVTWSDYYDESHYTPSAIRKLPGARAEGSDGDRDRNYELNVTELLTELTNANTREITLELRLQRKATYAQVTFFSREAGNGRAPQLVVDLVKQGGPPQ